MGKVCAAANCCSGQYSDLKLRKIQGKRPLSLSAVPKCPKARQTWSAAIDRVLTDKQHLCELHFSEGDVIKANKIVLPDGTVHIDPRKIYTLKRNANPLPLNNNHDVPGNTIETEEGLSPEIALAAEQRLVLHDVIAPVASQAPAVSKNCARTDEFLFTALHDSSAIDEVPTHFDNSNVPGTLTFKAEDIVYYFERNPIRKTWSWMPHPVDKGSMIFTQLNSLTAKIRLHLDVGHDLSIKVRTGDDKVNVKTELNAHSIENLLLAMDFAEIAQLCTGTGVEAESRSRYCTGFVENGRYSRTVRDPRCLPCKKRRKMLQNCESRKKRNVGFRYARSKYFRDLQHRQQRRLLMKVRQLKLRLNKCKQKCAGVEEDALSTAISELPLKQQEIVKACFSAAKVGNPRQRRYTVDWVYECVLMRIKNSKLYDHIRSRNILPLPTKDTLDRYTRRLKSTYGFQNAVFDCLKINASRMEDAEKCGTLLIDEMSLSEAITFDRRTMQFNGFVDLGRYTSPSQQDMRADHALVFMFQPFRGKWVQVLGAFLSKNSVTSKDLHKLLLECVLLLGKAGFHVDAVTMDGAQWNRGVWSIFGVRDGKFSCEHPCDGTKRLWIMSDFPHLIKCLRNGLMNCQMFWTPSGLVQKKHWEALLRYESYTKPNLKVAYKLTPAHLQPKGYQKMNVPLAFQLFSLPVRVAMEVFQSECCALRDSTPTINFCKVVDDLISAMMSRIPREALRPSDTCKHKKRFFGMMRNACGSNDHPDPALFIQVFRLLCSYSLVKPPKGSNVSGTELLETLMKTEESMAAANSPKQMWLDKIDSIVESQHVLASEEPLVSKSHRDIDTVSIWSQSDHLSCHDYDVTSTRPSVQSYVTGYVARKMCRLTKCSECIGTLKNTIPQERDIVIDEMSQFGGLTYPSDELFSLTSTLEAVVLDVVGKMTVKINTLHQVLDKVSEIKNLQYVGCQAHNEELTKRVINYYLVMRGHFLARSVNENNHARKMKTKDNRKKSKL